MRAFKEDPRLHPHTKKPSVAALYFRLLGTERESSTLISGLVKSGSVKVVAGYYDLGTGSVTLLTS